MATHATLTVVKEPNGSKHPAPPRGVLGRFGVVVERYLGGRANRHWLVQCNGRRLVLRRHDDGPIGDIRYEVDVMNRLNALGWPAPVAITDRIEVEGRTWCLFTWLRGASRVQAETPAGQRQRGRLLAQLHGDLETLVDLGQRPGCGRAEEIVADPELHAGLRAYERRFPYEAGIMRWHLDRAQERLEQLDLGGRQLIVLHGDFIGRNLLYEGERLTGIVDFEATHLNHRASEFALAWRGKHDAVIDGYHEVRPLDALDRTLLAPALWSWVFLGVADALRRMAAGIIEPHGFDWQIGMLLRRSPLMGDDSPPYPGVLP